jgi:chromate transporter
MSANRLLGLILVFSPLSILSIGGGQATIPEIQHQTVIVHGWLTNDEFADLFAIARAAPGPSTLIVALIGWQVAGFLGRWWRRSPFSSPRPSSCMRPVLGGCATNTR